MQVSVERQQGLERTLKVEIPSDRIEQAVEERLNKIRGQVRVDGFRPGKVPLRVVRQRYGGQVRQEVMGELIQSSLQDAVSQTQLQPAGSPRIDAVDEQPEAGGVQYTATFEVYPDIELADVANLRVERPVAQVEESDIDNMIETLRKQRETYEEVDRPAARGDRVVIDFVGRLDGEAFEGGSGQDTPVDLGAGQMVDGFEDQLDGIQAGETREIRVTFPDDYGAQELAGREVVFEVTCKAVQEGRLPAVDAAFAQEFGIESGSIEELRDGLRRNMERELRQAVDAQVKRAVMDALARDNPIDVPEAVVEEEVGRLREQMKQRMGGQMDDAQLPDELFREEAQRRGRLGLLLAEVVQRNQIRADDESVRAKVEEMASAYEDPAQVVQYYYENNEMLQGVQAMVVEDRVVDWILERAQVTEVPSSFDEMMRQQNGQMA